MTNAQKIFRSTTFLAILACWLWSTAFVNVKIGLQYNSPFQFAGFRFMIAGILLFIYFGKPRIVIREVKAYWKFILLLSAMQFFAQYSFFYLGMMYVPGALGAMIIGSSPLFIAVVAHIWAHNDKMTPIKTGSIFIGIFGIAIITLGRSKVELKNELEFLGIGLLIVNNIVSGISNVMVSKYRQGRSPLVLSATTLFIGGLMLFLVAIPVEGINWGPFPPVYYFTLGWLSFLSAAAFAIWYTLLQRPGVKVSILNTWKFLIPASGAALSWLLIKEEQPDLISIIGMLVITISLVILNYANRKAAKLKSIS
jgi:drug/metabolite transporter (DMT)-like permease